MPASYAHHRFGNMAIPELPEEVRDKISRFRRMYDVGQHGPDFFFYYQPLFHTRIGELGHTYHMMKGREFFEAAASKIREKPSEAAEAYLYGVLGHFALDSVCHPMVRAAADRGEAGHTELETDFDRHLLVMDGKHQPHLQDLGRHMRLTWAECDAVSRFYRPATAFAVRRSVTTMAVINRMLAIRNRKLLEAVLHLGGKSASEMVMYPTPNRNCVKLLKPLMERYHEAAARYPGMAYQLAAHIREKKALGTEFDVNFG